MGSRCVLLRLEESPIRWGLANGKRAARPIPGEKRGAARPFPLPGPAEGTGAGVLTGPGRGSRRCPGKGEGRATSGSPPLRVPGAEATDARLLYPGNDCPQRHNKAGAGFGRPGAAFVQTGHVADRVWKRIRYQETDVA